jgi:DNA-binding CsgD family transcriptional regulator
LLDSYERLDAARIGLHEHRTRSFRVMLALLRGEYQGLDEKLDELRKVGRKTVRNIAEGVYGAQMFALQRDLGKLAELAPLVEAFTAAPGQKAWTPGLMICLAEIGKLDAARRELERLAEDGFDKIPADDLRLTTLIYCAETCCILDDAGYARQLLPLLMPYSGTFACHPTVVCFGSTDHYLGMLSATVGDLEAAQQFFETATRANTSARAWPWLARSYYQFARTLRSVGDEETRRRAERFLREGEQLAGSLGMEGLAANISRQLRGDESGKSYPDGLTVREVDVLRLIAIGRSNKDIGKVLSISLNTVATHVRNILVKTECANRTEAAGYANRHQLIDMS